MTAPAAHESPAFGRYAPNPLTGAILALTRRCPPNWLGKRCAFFLRNLAQPTLRGLPLDIEALGARMRLYPYNNVCERRILFTPRFFDEAEREFLRGRLRPDFTFIDVGANIGGYTLFAAAVAGPRARIVAIEPQPDIFERLTYNIGLNRFPTVKALNCAVADRDGEITLFVARHNYGETSMSIVGADAGGARMRAPAKTLKTIILEENFERVDAIKLDVEGAEDVVLEPFFRTAPESLWPKLLMMEFMHERAASNLPRVLAECGYRETLRTRRNVAFERD